MLRRHTLAFAAFAAITLLAAGCADQGGTPVTSERGPDPLLVKIAAAGFDTTGAVDLGDSYRVEGDIALSKTQVSTWPSASRSPHGDARQQWRTYNVVGQTEVYGLRVDLSGLASIPAWQTAARQALVEWNRVNGSAVYLVEGSPADITIQAGGFDDCRIAALASWPSGNKPGSTITVNSGYCGSPNNSSTRLRNMVHELGHTLGFRHTNWQQYACGSTTIREPSDPEGAVQIPGTPQTDAASVMNGCTAGSEWAGFSANDQLAVRTLYPRAASVVIEYHPIVRVIGSPYNPSFSYAAYDANGNYIPYKRAQSITTDNAGVLVASGDQIVGVSPGSTTVRVSVDGVQASANVDVIDIAITGPSWLGWDEQGTYTATVTGPGGPYTPIVWTSGERTGFCHGQLTCTITGSMLGESYIQFFVRDERSGWSMTRVKDVNL